MYRGFKMSIGMDKKVCRQKTNTSRFEKHSCLPIEKYNFSVSLSKSTNVKNNKDMEQNYTLARAFEAVASKMEDSKLTDQAFAEVADATSYIGTKLKVNPTQR